MGGRGREKRAGGPQAVPLAEGSGPRVHAAHTPHEVGHPGRGLARPPAQAVLVFVTWLARGEAGPPVSPAGRARSLLAHEPEGRVLNESQRGALQWTWEVEAFTARLPQMLSFAPETPARAAHESRS